MQIRRYSAISTVSILTVAICILAGALAFVLWKLRQSAQDLAQAQKSLHLAEKTGGVGTWELDHATKRVHWSPHIYTIHARDPDKGPPALLNGIYYYHPDDRAMVGNHIQKALSSGEDFEFRARIIGDDNIVKNILSRGSCKLDREGKVTGLYGAFVDMDHNSLPQEYKP